MKTSGLFTLHRFTIPVKAAGVPITIIPFGDVHRDAPLHAKEEWQKFLAYARGLGENVYFLGLGDYVDSASTSERDCLVGAKLHESTRNDLDELARAKVSLLAKELAFMKGRLIGLMNGNHYYQFPDGTNTDNKLCDKLGCKYLGCSTFIRLTFEYSGVRLAHDIWAHHGAGAARLPGGSINRVEQMREVAEADTYIMGHDHARMVVPAHPRFSLRYTTKGGTALVARQSHLVRSGSFLKSYEDGQVSYNSDAARGPRSLGHVELEFTFVNTTEAGRLVRRLDVRGIA